MENLNSFEVMCLAYGHTLLKGGCSISMWKNGSHIEHFMPNRGFVVGGLVPEESIKIDNEAAFKHTFLRMYRSAVTMTEAGRDVVLGTWVEDGNKIVFDLCDITQEMKPALELASQRGERAIFDLDEEREIFVNHK